MNDDLIEEIIHSSLRETLYGFFAGPKIWTELGMDREEIEKLFLKIQSLFKNENESKVGWKYIDLYTTKRTRCKKLSSLELSSTNYLELSKIVRITMRELDEREYPTIMGRPYSDGEKVATKLEELIKKMG